MKQKVMFKMRNDQYKAEIVCTHNFIGKWQAEGFTVIGYRVYEPNVSVMDIQPSDINNNII